MGFGVCGANTEKEPHGAEQLKRKSFDMRSEKNTEEEPRDTEKRKHRFFRIGSGISLNNFVCRKA
jgi:hypothetical protein